MPAIPPGLFIIIKPMLLLHKPNTLLDPLHLPPRAPRLELPPPRRRRLPQHVAQIHPPHAAVAHKGGHHEHHHDAKHERQHHVQLAIADTLARAAADAVGCATFADVSVRLARGFGRRGLVFVFEQDCRAGEPAGVAFSSTIITASGGLALVRREGDQAEGDVCRLQAGGLEKLGVGPPLPEAPARVDGFGGEGFVQARGRAVAGSVLLVGVLVVVVVVLVTRGGGRGREFVGFGGVEANDFEGRVGTGEEGGVPGYWRGGRWRLVDECREEGKKEMVR
jgi:hypothetical protein